MYLNLEECLYTFEACCILWKYLECEGGVWRKQKASYNLLKARFSSGFGTWGFERGLHCPFHD